MDAYFLIPIGALVIESTVTLYSRCGKEFKYIWLCGFLYITALGPMIWVLELDLLASRQNLRVNPFAGVFCYPRGKSLFRNLWKSL